jgi:Ca-activated chloride channel family protein
MAWDRMAHTGDEAEYTLRIRILPGSATQTGMPLCLAIALDTSGSMEGEKLTRALESCRSIISMLRPEDKLWLATYSTRVTPILQGAILESSTQDQLNNSLAAIEAHGVTRMDYALQFLQESLRDASGAARVGLLITDGEPTDPKGKRLDNLDFLVSKASDFGSDGVTLLTVGLGNAKYFNTSFLVNLCDKAHGGFIYAESAQELEPLLRQRLALCQTIAVDNAQITLKGLFPGVVINSMCRYAPEYSPVDAPEEGKPRQIGALRADAPLDILVNVTIPKLPFGMHLGKIDAVEAELNYASQTVPSSAIASIQYTSSYSESQQLNNEVNKARLIWEINTHVEELQNTTDPYRTGDLLSTISSKANKTGDSKVMEAAQSINIDFKKNMKLDNSKKTGLLITARETGNLK